MANVFRKPQGPKALLSIKRSLSAKLLLLTVLFVLFVEFLLLIPSISTQRTDWLNARIEAAYLVGLALEAPDAEMIDPAVARQLFSTANILGVRVNRDGANVLIMAPDIDETRAPFMHYIDLRNRNMPMRTADAWATLLSYGDHMVRVIGEPTYAKDEPVDIIVSERALRNDLQRHAFNILGLSLLISTFTAGFVYWMLDRMMVEPVRRLTRNMMAFQANPDDADNIIAPSQRKDEIGLAERSLSALEKRINELLSQRRRLAALGAGVSKISHDLRNILASAQLMSDRLAKSDDPRVRKLSPRLIQALDRAIALSRDVLSYSRMEASTLSKSRFQLHDLVDEVFDDTAAMEIDFINETSEHVEVLADRTQLYRALFNIVRNAVDALMSMETEREKRVVIRARPLVEGVAIDIVDTAGGVPPEAEQHLFEPFRGSAKPGGSGLGAAIAYEIVHAHGGTLALAETGPHGSVFTITLPA